MWSSGCCGWALDMTGVTHQKATSTDAAICAQGLIMTAAILPTGGFVLTMADAEIIIDLPF
jgi:hypothetical protein